MVWYLAPPGDFLGRLYFVHFYLRANTLIFLYGRISNT